MNNNSKTTQLWNLCSHIFYNIWKYIKYTLEIEATVYKTFPAEIIDGPASAFFSLADRSILYIKKRIKTKTNKQKNRYITLSCATFKFPQSTSCLRLLSFIKYKLLKNIQMFVN